MSATTDPSFSLQNRTRGLLIRDTSKNQEHKTTLQVPFTIPRIYHKCPSNQPKIKVQENLIEEIPREVARKHLKTIKIRKKEFSEEDIEKLLENIENPKTSLQLSMIGLSL